MLWPSRLETMKSSHLTHAKPDLRVVRTPTQPLLAHELLAAFIGAGAFARLAGWRDPRRDDQHGTAVDAPYKQLPPPPPQPPCGVTGGGSYQLLPPVDQDSDGRYRFEIEKMRQDKS